MKKYLTTIFAVIAVLLVCFATTANALGKKAGDTSPAFSCRTLSGEMFESKDYRGKVLVISFWATWCSSCREEMQFLYRLSQKLSDKVVIVAINEETAEYDDEIIAHIKKTTDQWELPFPILLDENRSIGDLFGVDILPSSIIVDQSGVIQSVEEYFYTESETNVEHILHLLSDMVEDEDFLTPAEDGANKKWWED